MRKVIKRIEKGKEEKCNKNNEKLYLKRENVTN